MKIIFFLMLLSNITFFLWEFNSVNTVVEVASNETKQILLLSELPEKQREVELTIAKSEGELSLDLPGESKTKELVESVALATEGAEKDFNSLAEKNSDTEPEELSEQLKNNLLHENNENNQLDKKRFCYQVGPFNDEKLLINWIAVNKVDKNSITSFNKEKKIETGFLVYYPQAETYEESKQHIHFLENKGITDFWLFRKGELKGNISLGLFAKERRALLLKDRFVEAGINVEIMTRYRVESEWYANILSDNEIRSNMVKFTDKLSFVSSCDKI